MPITFLRRSTMSLNQGRGVEEYGNEVFRALSAGRTALATLRRHSEPVAVEDLAAALAANDETDLTAERDVLIDLTHSVLPKLEAAGLVERSESGVAVADHPALSDPAIRRLLDDGADGVLDALSDERRRITVSVLRSRSSPIDRRDLAAAVAARERHLSTSDVPEEAVSSVLASLHHVHLPTLENAGLIRIDDERRRIAYDGHPALDGAAGRPAVRPVSGD